MGGSGSDACGVDRRAFVRVGLAACVAAASGRVSPAAGKKAGSALAPVRPPEKWLNFRADRPNLPWSVPDPDRPGKKRTAPAVATFDFAPKLAFEGPSGDANEVGAYEPAGVWGCGPGGLAPTTSDPAAVVLADCEDFAFEAVAELTGAGGWFVFFGWGRASATVVSQSALRSGGNVQSFEIRNGRCDRSSVVTHANDFRPKGAQPVAVTIENRSLSVAVAGRTLLDGFGVPRYRGGLFGLATFANQYGTKPIRVGRFRIRSLAKK